MKKLNKNLYPANNHNQLLMKLSLTVKMHLLHCFHQFHSEHGFKMPTVKLSLKLLNFFYYKKQKLFSCRKWCVCIKLCEAAGNDRQTLKTVSQIFQENSSEIRHENVSGENWTFYGACCVTVTVTEEERDRRTVKGFHMKSNNVRITWSQSKNHCSHSETWSDHKCCFLRTFK